MSRLFGLVFSFSALALISQARGQVGNDNPTGPAGIFNGNITTGCSYDPYTANAMRSVTDITVAGAVGSYGLSFSRISNSRSGFGNWFGMPGAWQHSYEWYLGESLETTSTLPPTSYPVSFPDGRYEVFQYSSSDPVYFRAGAGVRERFQPLNTTNKLAYLILADGGKVQFTGTLNTDHYTDDTGTHTYYYWTFVASAIIDPYGLAITLTRNSNGWLTTITEQPTGRSIIINYGSVGGTNVITSVQGSDGRTVQYNYGQAAFSPGTRSYVYLSSVSYYSLASATYTYQAPNIPDWGGTTYNGIPLLASCNDPMYAGPMKKISYTYQTANNPNGTTAALGQIKSENYPGGPAVSSLTVNNSTTRTETRADGKTRTFTYSTPYRLNWTDFKGVNASQTWDANQYINSLTDRNGHTTNFSRNALTGLVTQIQYPLTQGDTPGQSTRPTVNYTYVNDYYLSSSQDEGGHTTTFTRDSTTHRTTQINYPDGGYETFTYNNFGEVTSHRMTTTGTETFTYDATGNKLTYRNPSNPSGNPTARYQYDALDRVSGVTDVLGTSLGDPSHTTNFTYNTRGQVTVTQHPTDPVDGARHTITNAYNSDGTLSSTTNELHEVTSYTYDDYRRVRSVTTPQRYSGDTPHTTYSYYDSSGARDDYTYADAKVTYVTLPSGKQAKTTYDENRRKTAVTVGYGTTDAATTSYGYDKQGNPTSVISPNGKSTVTAYDERNRPSKVTDALLNVTSFNYDTAGHKKSVTRQNNQTITYDSFDAMNRLLQQTATQTPDPSAVTKYTYTAAGLLATMQDPHLVAIGSTDTYAYTYDTMGRKTVVTYPAESGGAHRVNYFTYDTAGHLYTYQNRSAEKQTFTYDALNRMTGFSWNDGVTPSVTFGYDIASRLAAINNLNASISRSYYWDNTLDTETESITGGSSSSVRYWYDVDGNRNNIWYPGSAYVLAYSYTGRNQLNALLSSGVTVATYGYDLDGNLTTRTPNNSTSSSYIYDALDRVTRIIHWLNGNTRTFDYGYDNVGNRKWTKRDAGTGDVFGYDLNDQVTAVKLDIANPDTTSVSQNIVYDANGNRKTFSPYGTTDNYTVNNLNEYTLRNSTTAAYNTNADLKTGLDGSTYTYDAQDRLLSATKSGVTETFKYDGLNRQVSRTVAGVTTYNVYDGWDLIEEYQAGGTVTAAYLHGAGGLVKNLTTNNYYYQDGSGSTSHLADSTGHLLEWYRYDLQGTPIFYNFANTQQSASAYGVRHLFTGQQWYAELGLYDLRNRFYSPDIGRFLQPDPIGFKGDATNLYRYCGNNPVNSRDDTGLDVEVGFRWLGTFPHVFWGVTDPTSPPPAYTRWFDFVPTDSSFGSPGRWYENASQPAGYISIDRVATTPQQDLVIRAALQDAAANPGWFEIGSNNCIECGGRIIRDALGEQYTGFDPLDHYTGDIYNAQHSWVGWENPDSGNIYDSDWNWAAWDPNYQQNFTDNSGGRGSGQRGGWGAGSAPGGYGATAGYSPGYSGPASALGAPGPEGFGWEAAFSPTEGYTPKFY